jgi:hypothetical protein
MADDLGQSGTLSVTPEATLQAQDATAANSAVPPPAQDPQQLVGYIKSQYEIMRNHRNTSAGWTEDLLVCLRTFNGQYDANKLNEIRKFGGSEVYARITAQKCRAAASLLRDIYLGQDIPWAIRPPAQPTVPPDILQAIDQLMQQESQQIQQTSGKPPQQSDVQNRKTALLESADDAAKKKAVQQARDSSDKVEDILREGGFYTALASFVATLPIFSFSCICGPEVKVIPTVTWPAGGGQPKTVQTPKLTWRWVNPFDIYWTPGVADIANADIIEKQRITRAELNDALDLPGYNQEEVRAVLDEYGRGGLYDNWDTPDAERAVLERRENPIWNRSNMLSVMAFTGHVQGRLLQDYGLAVPDELRDYFVQVWSIGSHVIKAQMSPSPRQRHNYYITSFEKAPGSVLGHSLTELIADIQEVANATLRSLVNNLSIASGPQVVVNDDRLSPDETGEDMYPWKRWHVRNDPVSNNNQEPITFFMPTSNSQQLIQVFQAFQGFADDISAIPKYIGGDTGGGGAGRTASGLAMLMGNASKILQTVSANIDRDVMEPLLLNLTDMIMLTDTTGLLTGEEKISVQGVQVAVQRETQRQRQIEFLRETQNPTDLGIMGISGRGNVLRAVSQDIGLTGESIVPSEQDLEKKQQAQEAQQQAGTGAIEAMVQKGVQQGVMAGVQKITSELTAGILAAKSGMSEIGGGGTEPVVPGGPATQGLPPQQAAAASHMPGPPGAPGNQPPKGGAVGGGIAPQSATVVGSTPGPNARHQISPGPG